MSVTSTLADIWAQHGFSEPIPPRNPSQDWISGDYQERCMNCNKLFWGQRDAPLCKPCAAKFNILNEDSK